MADPSTLTSDGVVSAPIDKLPAGAESPAGDIDAITFINYAIDQSNTPLFFAGLALILLALTVWIVRSAASDAPIRAQRRHAQAIRSLRQERQKRIHR